jgi:hypothetical protein
MLDERAGWQNAFAVPHNTRGRAVEPAKATKPP